jgi:YHS domain-containing protein
VLSTPLAASELVNVSGATRVAIDGYDPVAFFTDGKAVNGSPAITAVHHDAIYYFATEEHRNAFTSNPERYAPQYGGFCAYGVGRNALFPVDINTWQIRDGRLYFNLNSEVVRRFNADFDGNVAKADRNWPGLVQKNGR